MVKEDTELDRYGQFVPNREHTPRLSHAETVVLECNTLGSYIDQLVA